MKSAGFILQENPKYIVFKLNKNKQIKSYYIINGKKNFTNILTKSLGNIVDLWITYKY